MKNGLLGSLVFLLAGQLVFSGTFFPGTPVLSGRPQAEQSFMLEGTGSVGNSFFVEGGEEGTKDASAKRRTGKYLIFGGMLVAGLGINLIFLANSSVTVPTYHGGYMGTKTVREHEGLRTPGIILVGCGLGMMITGFLVKKSAGSQNRSVLFKLDPREARVEVGLKIEF